MEGEGRGWEEEREKKWKDRNDRGICDKASWKKKGEWEGEGSYVRVGEGEGKWKDWNDESMMVGEGRGWEGERERKWKDKNGRGMYERMDDGKGTRRV